MEYAEVFQTYVRMLEGRGHTLMLRNDTIHSTEMDINIRFYSSDRRVVIKFIWWEACNWDFEPFTRRVFHNTLGGHTVSWTQFMFDGDMEVGIGALASVVAVPDA